MSNEELEVKLPLIKNWLTRTVTDSAPQARTVASLGFKRLPLFFGDELLAFAKVVYTDPLPMPPLNEMGLDKFTDLNDMKGDGITYLDTFFSLPTMEGNEAHHFHELVHVIQWQELGFKGFVAAWADGWQRNGYRHSPIEVMAYTLESAFRHGQSPFDASSVVRDQIRALYLRIEDE